MGVDAKFDHLHRFGGWSARWLAQVVMMTGTMNAWDDSSSTYNLNVDGTTHLVHIYTVGLLDIDARTLAYLVPDERMRGALINKTEEEFYAAAEKG